MSNGETLSRGLEIIGAAALIRVGLSLRHIPSEHELGRLINTHVSKTSRTLRPYQIEDSQEEGFITTEELFTEVVDPMDEAVAGIVKDALSGKDGTVILRPAKEAKTPFGRWKNNVEISVSGHEVKVIKRTAKATTGREKHIPVERFTLHLDDNSNVEHIVYETLDEKSNHLPNGIYSSIRGNEGGKNLEAQIISNRAIADASAHLLQHLSLMSHMSARINKRRSHKRTE